MKNLLLVAVMLISIAYTKAEKVKIVDDSYFVSNVFDVSKANSKFRGDKPVILDMYADWCPPCKKLAPVLDKLNGELGKKIDFIKINTDNNPKIPNFFKVQSIPTIVFINKDGSYSKVIGFHNEKELKKIIKTKFGI